MIFMRMTSTILVIQAVILCILAGCNKETPSKTQPGEAGSTQVEHLRNGEVLFKQFCSPCHPDGGNVSDPQRTLRGSTLKANHISTPADIVRVMRHPISRMIRFDETTISDQDARAIAEYVLATFK
jgi:cytochrome c6